MGTIRNVRDIKRFNSKMMNLADEMLKSNEELIKKLKEREERAKNGGYLPVASQSTYNPSDSQTIG